MDPIKCFQECRSGVVQIFLERDHEKIGSGSGADELCDCWKAKDLKRKIKCKTFKKCLSKF